MAASNPSMNVLVSGEDAEALRELLPHPTAAKIVRSYEDRVRDLSGHAQAIEAARGVTDDDLEVDDYPNVSPAEDGTWVMAWIWVPKES